MRTDMTASGSVPRGWWRASAWYAVAIAAALIIGEIGVRLSAFTPAQWYPQVTRQLDGAPARYMFVGSSRVGVGVAVIAFAEAQPPAPSGGIGPVYNMGLGFSTVIGHAIGLRRMADQGLLRGSLVFVEAPEGIPDTSTWRDRWYYREAPSRLVSVAGPRDLPGLWQSGMSVDDKIGATARTALKGSRLAVHAETIRVNGLAAAYQQAARLRAALAPERESTGRLELRDDSGARGDVDDFARIRAAAVEEGRRMLDEQVAVADWDQTVVAGIAGIVRAGGGEVVFFEMPLSPPMRLAAESDTGRLNARTFRAWAAARGIRVLEQRRDFPADAFPDVWHMSAPAADMFTQDLIEAWREAANRD